MSSTCIRLLLWLCVALMPARWAGARTFKYINFTSRDGLAGDNIYSIIQDHEGFVWIATETGLSRFDGTYFKNFTTRDGLPSNEIVTLFLDRKGRVWILPFKDEICYYHRGKLHNKRNDSLLARLPVLSESKSIREDVAGNILIQSWNGFVMIDTGQRLTVYPVSYRGKPVIRPVHSAGSGSNSNLIATPGFKLPFELPYFSVYSYAWCIPSYEYLAYSSSNGAPGLRKGESRVFIYQDQRLYHTIVVRDDAITWFPYSDSVFFIGYRDGCELYDLRNKSLLYQLLPGYPVNHAITDREGGIWIGSRGSGLFYLPSPKQSRLLASVENPALQATNFYRAQQDSQIIAGGWNKAIWRIDARTSTACRERISEQYDGSIFYPEKGNLLFASNSGAPQILRPRRLQEQLYRLKTISMNGDSLLLATSVGVQHFSKDNKVEQIWEGRSTCAFYLDGYYYVGTLNGLYVFEKSATVRNAQNTKPLLNNIIVSLAWSYRNGCMWVATSDNGVYCLRDRKVVKLLNEQAGLSSNICTTVFTDGSKLFAGTYHGLNVIDPDKGFRLRSYHALDGLTGDNITCIFTNGDLAWVATPEGVSALDLRQETETSGCGLFITGIGIAGRDAGHDTDRVALLPEQRDLEVSYSGICYRSMGSIRYYYRMVGLRDDWQTTTQNVLKYPSLPAGDYRLELYAVNRFGRRSDVHTLFIHVGRHWWQHGWVQALSALLALALAAMLAQGRIRAVRSRMAEKANLQEKIEELEQLALRAQMNPHFIFNSLNSFYQYVINKDLAGASKFMNDFSKLIRLLFEITALKELPLDKEIAFLNTYLELEKTKLNNSFTYRVSVDPDLPVEELLIPSFVIQPFVENSVRHGVQNRRDQAGEIRINIFLEGSDLIVSATDNGVGRAYTARLKETQVAIHQSKGIALTMERIVLYNKTHHTAISVQTTDRYHADQTAAGTTVTLRFPLKDLA